MTTTHPTARAEFEVLLTRYADACAVFRSRCEDPDLSQSDEVQINTAVANAFDAIGAWAIANRAVIAAALPTDTAPATLPDDWRPRPDADGD